MRGLPIVLCLLTGAAWAHDPGLTLQQKGALSVKLSLAIAAACGCQPTRVSVGTYLAWPDISDWQVDWPDNITDAQKAAGIGAMQGFNPKDPANQVR